MIFFITVYDHPAYVIINNITIFIASTYDNICICASWKICLKIPSCICHRYKTVNQFLCLIWRYSIVFQISFIITDQNSVQMSNHSKSKSIQRVAHLTRKPDCTHRFIKCFSRFRWNSACCNSNHFKCLYMFLIVFCFQHFLRFFCKSFRNFLQTSAYIDHTF